MTLFVRWTYQVVHGPFSIEIPSEQDILGGDIHRWILLFQEFDFEVIVKKGRLNSGLDHLSNLESGEDTCNLNDSLLGAELFTVKMFDDHYRDIMHFLTARYALLGFTTTQNK